MGKIQFVKGNRRPLAKFNYVDLFDEYENQPPQVSQLLSEYQNEYGENIKTDELLSRLEKETGYTFDYDFEGEPYGLRPIGVKLNELKGYEDMDDENGFFHEGGQVEQKIKNKIAKGAFELPMELVIYVPSTKEANQIIPKSELQQRVKSVKTYLSNLFGGFSSSPIDGGYVSEDKNKGLIEEDAVKVTAFATKEALESNMDAFLAKVKKWCAQWSQESIGLEFEGDLFYVSKTAKFNDGGIVDATALKKLKNWEVFESTKLKIEPKSNFNNTRLYYDVILLDDNGDFEYSFSTPYTSNKKNAFLYLLKELGERKMLSQQSKFNLGGQTNEEQNRAMILSQAKEVSHHVSELNEIMTKQPDIDAWVIAKMQDVTTGLSDITHYLDGRVGFRLGADDVSERMKEMLRDGGKTKFMKGGVAGDIYSLENPEQFKQLITIYNNLSEKTDLIKGYYLDHTDNSIVFLTAPNISDIGKDKIFGYVEFLKKQDFSIINWKKTIDHNKYKNYGLNWGTEKGSMILQRGREGRANPQWFKLYLIDRIKYKAGGEIILGGGSMASVQDSILAKGAKLKSGKLTLAKLRSMIEEYNSQGRNFELLGAYNQLELWSNDHRIEAGSKEDIYRALIRYRYNPKYSDGAELSDLDGMTDEEIITFANTLSYYDRMDEGIEEEFDNVEDAKEYLRMMEE